MKLILSLAIASLLATSRLHAAAPACESEPARVAEVVNGEITRGEQFQTLTPSGWIFRLSPIEFGWFLEVSQRGREEEDFSRLTPPWHGPNHRILEGWQFRNSANTGPNDGSVNEPQAMRSFIYSPEVGRTIHYNGSETTAEDVDAVQSFGQGWLYLDSYVLSPPQEGTRASFEAISFTACLTWPQ